MNTIDFLRLGVPPGHRDRRLASRRILWPRLILGGGDKTRLQQVAAIVANPSSFLEDSLRKDFAKALIEAPRLRAHNITIH